MDNLVRLLTGRASRWVVLVGILMAVGVLATVERAETPDGRLDSAPAGADSTAGLELQSQLPDGEDAVAVVVATAQDDGELTQEQLTGVAAAVRSVQSADIEPLGPPLVASEDGTATLSVLSVPQLGNEENAELVDDLRTTVDDAAPAGVEMAVTGPAAVQADLSSVFEGASLRLLLVTASVVAVLLIITYRSPVLWLVPVVVIGLADQLAATLAPEVLQLLDVPWDGSTTGILSVLVFGAGTDYALLLISRYRDELRLHEDRHDAMAAALVPTSRAVVPSAVTVVLGLLTLVLSLIPTTRGLGLACAVGIVIGAGFVLTVLPGLLVLLGRWVFWPKVPRASMGPVDRSASSGPGSVAGWPLARSSSPAGSPGCCSSPPSGCCASTAAWTSPTSSSRRRSPSRRRSAQPSPSPPAPWTPCRSSPGRIPRRSPPPQPGCPTSPPRAPRSPATASARSTSCSPRPSEPTASA